VRIYYFGKIACQANCPRLTLDVRKNTATASVSSRGEQIKAPSLISRRGDLVRYWRRLSDYPIPQGRQVSVVPRIRALIGKLSSEILI